MQKYGGLGYICLFQVLVGPVEHSAGDPEAQNIVSLFKQLPRLFRFFIKVLAHSRKLGTLARENICFQVRD